MSAVVRVVPLAVREATVLAWGVKGLKAERHHAAKQLACWAIDHAEVGNTDENFRVDTLISLGMAAEVQPNAHQFIKWFEKEILEGWYGPA